MYDNLTFAPRKDATRVVTMQDALSFIQATQLQVTPHVLNIGELKINDDGSLTNGQTRQITKYGFENFCSILGIPNPFARKIPQDLLFTNIHRLQEDRSDKPVVLLERPDGAIANIVKAPYKEVPYGDVLSVLDGREFKYIDIGEQMLTMCLTFEETQFGLAAEDTFFVGTTVTSSIVWKSKLSMEANIYRTLCGNSFIMPLVGRAKADYRLGADERLLRFAESVRCYDETVLNRLKQGMELLPTRKMYRREVANVWRKLNTLAGEQAADMLIGLDPDTRIATISAEKTQLSSNRIARLYGRPVEDPVITDIAFYDVLNAITASAKAASEQVKLDLERYAGGLIQNLALS